MRADAVVVEPGRAGATVAPLRRDRSEQLEGLDVLGPEVEGLTLRAAAPSEEGVERAAQIAAGRCILLVLSRVELTGRQQLGQPLQFPALPLMALAST